MIEEKLKTRPEPYGHQSAENVAGVAVVARCCVVKRRVPIKEIGHIQKQLTSFQPTACDVVRHVQIEPSAAGHPVAAASRIAALTSNGRNRVRAPVLVGPDVIGEQACRHITVIPH